MATSDLIAGFILEALESDGGMAELQRAALADMFGCVPSQINYVISTRFSAERGYIVESRRGGGGYIRITRVRRVPEQLLMHMLNAVGAEIDLQSARAFIANAHDSGALDEKSARLILSAIGDNALRPLPPELRNTARASIFKQLLISAIP